MLNGLGLGRALLWTLLGGLALTVGCGDSDGDAPKTNAAGARPPFMGSGGSSRGGNAGNGDSEGGEPGEGGSGGEPVQMPGGPLVRVVSPVALRTPYDGDVLVDDEIDVICEVRKSPLAGSGDVDEATVSVQLLDAEGAQVDVVAATPGEEPGQFVAHLIVAKVAENGRLGILCSASDRSLPPVTGVGKIETFIDHGPEIAIEKPVAESVHALTGGVPFVFSINPDPVADDDDQAEVDHATLEVNGVDIELENDGVGDNRFSVDLSDPVLFPDPPNGEVPITIRGTNRREPRAVERVLSYTIVVDSLGPEIDIQSPVNAEVVGNKVALRFSVVDALSGVDPDSVVVELNGEPFRFEEGGEWTQFNEQFVFSFDSTQVEEDSKVQATFNIYASDEVGNEAEGESVFVYLDNVPPTVDLDPPNVREWRDGAGSTEECSVAFDPLGVAPPQGRGAPNDLDIVPRLALFRALVWEETNTTPGQTFRHHAGTNADSVFLFLQPDPSVPLLIDTNEDGVCDDVAEKAERITFHHLKAVAPAGQSWFGDVDATVPPLGVGDVECTFANAPDPPQHLCTEQASDLYRVIAHGTAGKPPVIYADGSLESGVTCTGEQWEFASEAEAEEGWLCFAARAVDNAENVGISRPLRLCYDDVENGDPYTPPCATGEEPPPSCVQNDCTLPPAFEYTLIAD